MTSFSKNNLINIWFRSNQGKDIVIFDTDMTMQQFNQFRRILLTEVEVVAIDLVNMIKNQSIMIDEILSNRLGNIPVAISDQNSIVRKDLCKCDSFCDECSFIIDFKSKEFTKKSWLMSNDISPFLMENIPIVTVQPGQKISFKLLCSKSTPRDHHRWSLGVRCNLEHLEGNPRYPNHLRVTLQNTGLVDFSTIFCRIFSIMRLRLEVDFTIH